MLFTALLINVRLTNKGLINVFMFLFNISINVAFGLLPDNVDILMLIMIINMRQQGYIPFQI